MYGSNLPAAKDTSWDLEILHINIYQSSQKANLDNF